MMGMHAILVHAAINFIEAFMLLIFKQIVFNETYAIKAQVIFCVVTGLINNVAEYLCRAFDFGDVIRSILMVIVFVVFLNLFFGIKLTNGLILTCLMLFLYALANVISVIPVYLSGYRNIDVNDIKLFLLGSVTTNFFVVIFLLIIKSVKFSRYFPKELMIKTLVRNFSHVFFTTLAVLINTSYYMISYGSTVNIRIILMDIILICYLVYSIVVSNKNQLQYKQMLDEIKIKNEELATMNEQLKNYSQTVEELAVARERNRFARDVHDSLGHNMALLIKLLQVISITCESDISKTKEIVATATSTAKEGLNELRRSIMDLIPEKVDADDIVSSVENLASDLRHAGIGVNLTIDGEKVFTNPHYADVIYRICQESTTNALKHGKAMQVDIALKFLPDRINLNISDNGLGCENINKGFGLSSMEKRVKELGGSVGFNSDIDKGFSICVEIPLIV